jgi:hypothetical protein
LPGAPEITEKELTPAKPAIPGVRRFERSHLRDLRELRGEILNTKARRSEERGRKDFGAFGAIDLPS